MQQSFKKVRNSWMEELITSLSSNPILTCDFAPILKTHKIPSLTFQVKSSSRTLSPPQLSIDIDHQTVEKINQKAIRTRKTIQANLSTDSLDKLITNIEELPPESFDGEDEQSNQNNFFKIGLAIVRQQGIKKTKQRIERQLRHCSQRSGARFTHLKQKKDPSDLYHLLLSLVVRMFLTVQQKEKKLKIVRLLYYPKVDIQIQKTKITPFSVVRNQTVQRIRDRNCQKQIQYGYVSLSQFEKKQYNILLLSIDNFPVIGIFIAGKLGGQLKQDSLLWCLIMQYLSNPLLNNRRICLNGPRTGFFFHFQQNNRQFYQFQVPASAKWKLSTSVQIFASFPKEIVFATRQAIIEEDREESEVESVHSKQVYPLQDGPPDTYSTRSFDQKDLQITRLKAELQKYKNQNQWLKQLVGNIMNSQSNPKAKSIISPQSNISKSFFGSYDSETQKHKESISAGKGEKQFKIKDSKNISFAQQNSYEEQGQMGSFLQDDEFFSPQFALKQNNVLKKQVKPFEFLDQQQRQAPYFQQKKKQSLRQPFQTFNQDKSRELRICPQNISQIRSTFQTNNSLTKHSLQKRDNLVIERQKFSPKKGQNNQAQSQRSKALGQIIPKQLIEIPKKYLEQEINQQGYKKEMQKKTMLDRKKQQGDKAKRNKKISAVNSESDDEEVNKIIAERNRRK